MTQREHELDMEQPAPGGDAGTKTAPEPTKQPPALMPQYKVLLHNDDSSDMGDVIDSIVMLTPLNKQEAGLRMQEAHKTGVALLLVTHKERAELYAQGVPLLLED